MYVINNEPEYTLIPRSYIHGIIMKASADHIRTLLYLIDAYQYHEDINIESMAEAFDTSEADINRSLHYLERKNVIKILRESDKIYAIEIVTSQQQYSYQKPNMVIATEETEQEKDTQRMAILPPAPSWKSTSDDYPVHSDEEEDLSILSAELIASIEADDNFKKVKNFYLKFREKSFGKKNNKGASILLPIDEYEGLIRFFIMMHKDSYICNTIIDYVHEMEVDSSGSHKFGIPCIDAVAFSAKERGYDTPEKIDYYLREKKWVKLIRDKVGTYIDRLNEEDEQLIRKWYEEYQMTPALILEAAKEAGRSTYGRNRPIDAIDNKIEKWHKANIKDTNQLIEFKKVEKKKYQSQAILNGTSKGKSIEAGKDSSIQFNRFEQREHDFANDEKTMFEFLKDINTDELDDED